MYEVKNFSYKSKAAEFRRTEARYFTKPFSVALRTPFIAVGSRYCPVETPHLK